MYLSHITQCRFNNFTLKYLSKQSTASWIISTGWSSLSRVAKRGNKGPSFDTCCDSLASVPPNLNWPQRTIVVRTLLNSGVSATPDNPKPLARGGALTPYQPQARDTNRTISPCTYLPTQNLRDVLKKLLSRRQSDTSHNTETTTMSDLATLLTQLFQQHTVWKTSSRLYTFQTTSPRPGTPTARSIWTWPWAI